MKTRKSIAGVTLLEIMLVLAIAAMVIVMSVRYYQSASLNQKMNATLDSVTGIMAGGESVLAAVGTLSNISSAQLAPYMPNSAMPSSPWGGAMTIATSGANSYVITIPNVPSEACTPLTNLIGQNSKLKFGGTCPGAATVTVTE
jgi:Tfp pilus assembly protein FimT